MTFQYRLHLSSLLHTLFSQRKFSYFRDVRRKSSKVASADATSFPLQVNTPTFPIEYVVSEAEAICWPSTYNANLPLLQSAPMRYEEAFRAIKSEDDH